MKMAPEVRWLLAFLISCVVPFSRGETPHRKFEYKYSFKPPYLAQKDGTVPFWEYGGNTIASAENVRVAPSLKSQKGAIWSKLPVTFDWWEVDLVFRISGRSRIGADGLAFWYTTAQGAYNGTVFGSSDLWTGLGIFFDSFDNDNKHNNPYIMAIVNDGTKIFDHANDGSTQQLAGCLRDFRNKPFATRARIEYYQNTLTLMFHNGMTNNDQDYEMCFRIDNVVLPKNGYFGISAATGGLADDHDILHFLTLSLYPPGQLPVDGHKVSLEEQAKLQQEYFDYQKKLDEQKEEYRKEHPDKFRKQEYEEYYETESQKELRQIFNGQSQIYDVIREIFRKLDEIVGRQEREMSLISQVQAVQAGMQVNGQVGQQPVAIRQNVDATLNNQDILTAVKDMRSYLEQLHTKIESILNNQARAPTAQVQCDQSKILEILDTVNKLKKDKPMESANCPNCLSVGMFLLFIAIQMIILLVYSIYRDNKEAQMKKLY